MSPSRAAVKDKDLGLEDILKEMQRAKDSYVIIGFPDGVVTKAQTKDSRKKKGGISMAGIAAANEFGTDTIPARSFMRSSFDENLPSIIRALRKEYDKISLGQSTVQKSLGLIGLYMQNLIKQKIRAIHTPPNSPKTIAKKGSSKPLIDFGQMIGAVQYKVVIK